MFSKRTVIFILVIALIAVNAIVLVVSSQRQQSTFGPGRFAIPLIGPAQKGVTLTIRYVKNMWRSYFLLVSVSEQNERLRAELRSAQKRNNALREDALSNDRLRSLLKLKKTLTLPDLSAEIVGNDPSPHFKSVTIDKGSVDGVEKGLPVLVSDGIAGVVTDVSFRYAKVLLVIDRNSGIDALIQESRARGIVKGGTAEGCSLQYVLRKHDVAVGDTVITSGLDGVFPKGLRIGSVASVVKRNSGIFQDIAVKPFVDFEGLEEVLVLLYQPAHVDGGRP